MRVGAIGIETNPLMLGMVVLTINRLTTSLALDYSEQLKSLLSA